MNVTRKAGILLHPTSLPCSAGIGTLGKAAFSFIDFLSESGMKLWQVLPLGPTGYGDSPYQSFSAFALNPLLIDFDDLVERGWADSADTKKPSYVKKNGPVDYGAVVYWKNSALKKISRAFLEKCNSGGEQFAEMAQKFAGFCAENEFWLNDYALFMSIKSFYDEEARKISNDKHCKTSGTWNVFWPKKLSSHNDAELQNWHTAHETEILQTKIIQFFAFSQWSAVHEYARRKNIEIIGDIPIFVAPDSSDVWANQKLFQIEKNGTFTNVAGVPPDYFSKTGQLWGNPLYDWKTMKKDGYKWWIARISSMLKLVDYIRIDHFRGFESYWAVPFGSETAVAGEWMKGPGKGFFDAVQKELGDVPLLAEDLGIITDEVRQLRDAAELPGMKVIQFGFDTNELRNGALVNAFLPHNYSTTRCIAYTGTHDNDTTQGFLEKADAELLGMIAGYVTGEKTDGAAAQKLLKNKSLCRMLIREALSSIAQFAIIPMQDVYALSSDARMNMPSTSGTNWSWRAEQSMIVGEKAQKTAQWLKTMCTHFAR